MDRELKEHSDLLSPEQKILASVERRENSQQPAVEPPDGGLKACFVVLGSFLTNGLLFGVINSYSVIYNELVFSLKADGVPNAETRASLAGALTIGTTFFLSPVSGVLTAFLGLRLTAVLGGSIAALGLLFSSFVVENVDAFCFTYGIMYGLGASLAYTPSLAILGHYYKKKLGIVNGFVTVGSSVFTVILPMLMDVMIKNYGLQWMFRLLSLVTIKIAFCGLLFTPVSVVVLDKPLKEKKSLMNLLRAIGNVQLWKNKKYRLWALCMPVALFGYFVPYVHIKTFIKELKIDGVNDNLPLQCLAVTSGVGRILFGYLGDMRRVDKIFLQQISFYVIGVLTIILAFIKSFTWLVVIVIGMGLFEGGFIALIGPIAFELCGPQYAAQSIGWMLGLAAVPLCIGPTVAGAIFSKSQSYTLPFALAGISPLVGATLMFTVRLYKGKKSKSTESNTNGHIMPLSSGDAEKGVVSMLASNGKINQ